MKSVILIKNLVWDALNEYFNGAELQKIKFTNAYMNMNETYKDEYKMSIYSVLNCFTIEYCASRVVSGDS